MKYNLAVRVLAISLLIIIVGFMLVVIFKHATTKTNPVSTNTVSLQAPTPLPQRIVTAQPFPHSGPLGTSFSHHPKSQ